MIIDSSVVFWLTDFTKASDKELIKELEERGYEVKKNGGN